MADPPTISVIIPAYNEEETIASCLAQFRDALDRIDIIMVDGGSADRTVSIAEQTPGVRIIHSPECGRAVQMNAGAAQARGDLLIFLHADTVLPTGWPDIIAASIFDRGMAGGRFRLSISDPGKAYRWIEWGNNFRSRTLGVVYGDQAIYTSRALFEKVGGYPCIPIFEDSDFCNLLKKEGDLDWIDTPVATSARRWQKRGALRTVLLTWTLRILYNLSISPETLTRYYRAVR